MRRKRWLIGSVVAVFVFLSTPAIGGQAEGASHAVDREGDSAWGTWQVGPWFGAARQSPVTPLLGSTPGRNHVFAGIQAVTPVRRLGSLRVAYVVQILPVVAISGRTPPLYYPGQLGPDGLLPGPSRAYAFGVSPFGIELASPQESRLSVFGAAAAGALFFSRPFPVPEAERVNFTLEFGGGVRMRTRVGQWVQLGYKFHHLSNAYLGQMNPGLDAHVFYAGYQWSARLLR
jgi:hypothetical protein